MRYNTILFDFDGTLTESGVGIMRSAAYAFEKLGVPVPNDAILRAFIGPPLVASFEKYAGLDEAGAYHATDVYRERYLSIGWKENRVYTGIAPLLKALKREGCYLAIASAKPEPLVVKICEYFGLTKYFDCIVGVKGEGASADKDELLRSALPQNYDPARAAMVGDRLYDMLAAKRLGLHAVGALYGYGSREELLQSGADEICENVRALREYLLPDAAPERGKFISFEGSDGCGKSTQMNLVREYLRDRGYDVVVTREPGGCPVSERIRETVLDIRFKGMSAECEALLYAAARAEHVRQVILPSIEQGKIVLCDRFLDSSIAYQAFGRELGEDFIRQINRPATIAVPDRTLVFAGDTAATLKRLRSGESLDRIEVESDAFFERVNRAFVQIARSEPERVHLVNSDRSIEEISRDVRQDIDALLS